MSIQNKHITENPNLRSECTHLAIQPRWYLVVFATSFAVTNLYLHNQLLDLTHTVHSFSCSREVCVQYGHVTNQLTWMHNTADLWAVVTI